MVELVPSILALVIELPGQWMTITVQETGSINFLSQKYGFVVDGNNYNFTPVTGRNCWVRKVGDNAYRFLGYMH
jgi:hypothetical protein